MKKRPGHIAAWILLSAALLFNQVGLNFFHDSHEAHEFFSAAQKSKTILLNHGEHCEVCSLEVLFNVILPVTTELPRLAFDSQFDQEIFAQPVAVFVALRQGRAPPAIA